MRNYRAVGRSFLFLVLVAAGPLAADVKMPAIFGDHMVLQQAAKIPVWGMAAAGEKITVTVAGQTATTTAGADGKWRVTLAPLAASAKPVTMTVAGTNTLTFSDVVTGDVWICSGQSNMEFGLGNVLNAKDEIAQANLPLVHLFLVPRETSLTPQADIAAGQAGFPLQAHWVVCTPGSVVGVGGWNGFSAVGYFFGREMQKVTGQPVGLIGTYWGGTTAQAWTSEEKINSDPALKSYANNLATILAKYPAAMAAFPAQEASYEASLAKWEKANNVAPTASSMEIHTADMQARAAKKPGSPHPPNPADGGSGTPANLFNGMIAPLIPYAIKGAIWYQGESNASAPVLYGTLFPDMITDWRQKWGEGDFPFLFVQLARFKNPNPAYALLRESQAKTLALPNTGMAIAFDIGDENDIHPKDKLDVGRRLALAAQHVAYGKDLVYSGPVYDKMQVQGGAIRVSFTQAGGGLMIGTAPWTPAAPPAPKPERPTAPGQPAAPRPPVFVIDPPLSSTTLSGFVIAGADQNWQPAEAKIDGNDVVVSSAQVPQPVAVRYAFIFALGNLYNKEGLPAPPLRTDTWDVPLPKPPPPPAPKPAAAPVAK